MGIDHDFVCHTCRTITYLGYAPYHSWSDPESNVSKRVKETVDRHKDHITRMVNGDYSDISPEGRVTVSYPSWDREGQKDTVVCEDYSFDNRYKDGGL